MPRRLKIPKSIKKVHTFIQDQLEYNRKVHEEIERSNKNFNRKIFELMLETDKKEAARMIKRRQI